ncbi:MAG: T9SS type A sorting domain-containing protein [Bacteroidales bacterium]|nr:T9SS type A sorting domain-containing protein [Bacteroidales bacterium]
MSNPPAGTIYWTVSNTNIFTVNSTGNPTTVIRIGTGTNSVTLSAHTGSTDGTVIASKIITPCPLPVITGPKEFCSLRGSSYTVTDAPTGFTWGSSSNLTLSGSSGNTVSASVTGSGSSGWVSVNLGTTELARYNVYMEDEAPVVDRIDGPLNVTTTGTYEAVLSSGAVPSPYYDSLPSTYFDWTVYDDDASVFGNGYGHINVFFSNTNPKSYSLYLSVTNACGVDYDYITISASGTGYYVSSYPNPASDILNIEIDQQAAAQAQSLRQTSTGAKRLKTEPAYDIRLYDYQGNLLRHAKIKGGRIEFNVANLPNGIYYLNIYDGIHDKPEMRQIVVEH